ncbi:MAG: hypothetical protein M3R17_19555 [Bacteroidota bacterium]|nr:hypothetical protein [Bacteroidota bacterium]
MKKTVLLIFPALFFVLHAPAQTKRISMLSHSGKKTTISSEGNFGLSPEMFRYSERQWDSIHKADSLRADSAARITRPQGTGAKYIETDKPQQPNPESSLKAGTWLEKSQH